MLSQVSAEVRKKNTSRRKRARKAVSESSSKRPKSRQFVENDEGKNRRLLLLSLFSLFSLLSSLSSLFFLSLSPQRPLKMGAYLSQPVSRKLCRRETGTRGASTLKKTPQRVEQKVVSPSSSSSLSRSRPLPSLFLFSITPPTGHQEGGVRGRISAPALRPGLDAGKE